MNRLCGWCGDAAATEDDVNLCRPHLAEYLGESLASLDRMESEQHAEYADAYGY